MVINDKKSVHWLLRRQAQLPRLQSSLLEELLPQSAKAERVMVQHYYQLLKWVSILLLLRKYFLPHRK